MNGNGFRNHSYSSSQDPDIQIGSPRYEATAFGRPPPAKVMLESYNQNATAMNGGVQGTPRPQSYIFNATDPVTMHLLVETAIGDSQEFEVLSFEEIDELKKEQVHLASRIDALRRKLALESKVRDAAHSLNRLYSRKSDGSDGSPKRHRRSFLGSKGSGGELLEKTDDEVAASSRKCEDVAQELWKLEKRSTEIQRRLLQHTAGILQMTHRANSKRSRLETKSGSQRPGSAGSVYTYSRGSVQPAMEEDDFDWDDRSQYRTLDEFSSIFDGRSKSRSPARPESRGIDMHVANDTEKRLQELNTKLKNLLMQANPEQAQSLRALPNQTANGLTPPTPAHLQDQLDFLESGLDSVSKELHHSGQRAAQSQSSEPILQDLWSKMQRSEAEARQRKQEMRQNADSDASPDEDEADEGEYSVHALSSKVQFLHRRTIALKEQKGILRRQIKQQRAITSRDDSAKDSTIDNLKSLLQETDEEATKAREEVVIVMDRLEAVQNQLRAKDDQIAADIASRDREAQTRVQSIQDSLTSATQTKAAAEAEQQRLQKELETKDAEMRELEQQTALLQTEVTMAKAELDGAYGTRAQRAAENAAATEASGALKDRVALLEKELKETISEYEAMTKQSIEFEKERETLEQTVDGLQDRCQGLEGQLSEEKLKWLGTKGGGGAGPQESTSTMVMRNEFKKMMRDTRAEHAKALKAEIEERRKLEMQLRALRGTQTPSKSSHSQSTSTS